MPRFYSVIIGTELLNGRRVDKHFTFLNQTLRKRNFLHVGNFVIQDDPLQIHNCFTMILNDPQSVMFCFGGLGATPDDMTRMIASEVFTGHALSLNKEAQALIEAQFGDEAYPHRIHMAMLPPNAKLLRNVVNRVPGFSLQGRFFFMPGFPSMAWPMVVEALERYFPESEPSLFHDSFIVEAAENDLIDIMQAIPCDELYFSSLPRFVNDKRFVEIYLAHVDHAFVEHWSHFFKEAVLAKGKKIKDCW
jgi:molybdopterin-biosynthesis enzyme MoeA-like protein